MKRWPESTVVASIIITKAPINIEVKVSQRNPNSLELNHYTYWYLAQETRKKGVREKGEDQRSVEGEKSQNQSFTFLTRESLLFVGWWILISILFDCLLMLAWKFMLMYLYCFWGRIKGFLENWGLGFLGQGWRWLGFIPRVLLGN